jgi:hypothetical protein
MKFCYSCGHSTGGEPLFCNSCGRSYDVKLCPKLHVNPRIAEACSQCGSRDLSIPQPKVPAVWQVLALLIQVLWGVVLAFVSIPFVLRLLVALLTHSEPYDPLIFRVFLVALLWFLWTLLPMLLRWMIYVAATRRNHGT